MTPCVPRPHGRPSSFPSVPPFTRALVLGCAAVLSSVTAGCRGEPERSSSAAAAVSTARTHAEDAAPSLVVLVVADQLRGDLPYRYRDLFRGGFRRLLDEGYSFRQASHRHGITETAVGHTTLSTGAFPSHHGIVGNDWLEERDGRLRSLYAVEDPDAPIAGAEDLPGRSPRNLMRGGLADWVEGVSDRARVVSISSKDRAAIPMAGRSRGWVFWMDKPRARFVTSSYYRDHYPDWVEAFNRDVMPGLFGDSVWTSVVPDTAAGRSRPDQAAYEGDGVHTTFPHHYMAEAREPSETGLHEWVGRRPPQDEATLGLVLRALDELDLGRRGVVDYLGVSFSAVDYVGHDYGPLSREQLDNLLRLDGVLGRLLEALDEKVGPGRWVLALSADHGIMDSPEWRVEQGLPGARLPRGANRELREAVALARAEGRDPVATAEAFPFVARAYARADLEAGAAPDSFAPLYRNGIVEGRFPGVLSTQGLEVRGTEGTLMGGERLGSGHGTPYWYDRWVAMVFLGAGVPAGSSEAPVATVDVAPTLARLAGIPVPEDVDGKVLEFSVPR